MQQNPIHIAVIVSTIDEVYQSGILSGIRQFAFANRVTLEHFVAFGNIGSDHSHDIGEYHIFSLANFSRFDGVILIINTIQDAACLEQVLRRVRESGIPAVCIDKDVEGLYSIGIDNETAMYSMVEHFIVHHGFRQINYVSGPEDNVDSMLRLKAYRSALTAHGIPVEEERIYRGRFVARDGALAVQSFLSSPDEFPEAIVCANDNMAVAAVNALMQRGVRVPEDVAVSGFDYTENARNYAPSVTSVERPLTRVGMLACQKILNHLDGKPQERCTTLETRCCFSQSCGCNAVPLVNSIEFRQQTYDHLESFTEDVSLSSRLASALADCDSMQDFISKLRLFIPEFGCREFYLCLRDSWKRDIMPNESDENDLMHILEPEPEPEDSYGNTIMVPLAYKEGEFIEMEDFPTAEMLPGLFDEDNAPGNYYFVPLHFRERTMGYIVIRDSIFPTSSKLFHSCMIDIANYLENVRKIICLDRITQKLNKLYTLDSLANINNRNGFRISTQHLYQSCINAGKPVMLMFLDMDGLKFINDTYGHKSGDTAIATMAEVLRTACSNGEVCCRFGGDEFIIFAADYTEARAKALSEQILSLLDRVNRERGYPFTLGTSLGYHITIPQEGVNLFQLVTIADNIMYEQKKKKKTSRYLKRPGTN